MSKVYLTFEDMQNCPAADDVDSADIVLSADGCDGPMRWCPENQDWFPFKQFVLDLSPLQKFMGMPRKRSVSFFGVSSKMYGMDYDFDWVPPAPSPEKSPQEKALDDFIAKRKAKREGSAPGYGWDVNSAGAPDPSYHKDMYHLDRAMRRISFHEQDIHTRLMPYRREE